ncbi:hypothetical protein [Bifidobacterium sp.]|uniref:hypothetical protein n=1 Tax=Bifidobacterium sp. TaxID=41200 RepID=UPI0039EB25BF
MSRFNARLVAYEPRSTRIGVLPRPVSWDASFIHNGRGALSLSYSRKALKGDILSRALESGLEIAVEVSTTDGTDWTEPYNGRFVLLGRERDANDATDTVKLTCPSYEWLMSRMLNLATSNLVTEGDDKGKRKFLSSNPGIILRTLLDEYAARTGGSALTVDFTTAKTSSGANWASQLSIAYELGIELSTILENLADQGIVDWRTQDRTLRVFNASEGEFQRDLSATVRVQPRDVTDAPESESIEEVAGTILVRGDNDLIFTKANPEAPKPWGVWESYMSQGGVSVTATAEALMQKSLESASRVRGQYTRSVVVTGNAPVPLITYRPGDWITAPTVTNAEKVRVQQITLSYGNDGLKTSLILNDKVYDRSIRNAKRVEGISGGATLTGGASGERPAEATDKRIPSAPQGLAVQTDAYVRSDGAIRATATFDWQDVTTATNGTALEVQSYVLYIRENIAGAPYSTFTAIAESRFALELSPGVQYAAKVRAVGRYATGTGLFSSEIAFTAESDTEPPAVPSAPLLSTELGTVTVKWDGFTEVGSRMAFDFDHCNVYAGLDPLDLTLVGAVSSPLGHHILSHLTVGSTIYVALTSMDRSGNESAPSQSSSITVEGIDANATIQEMIQADERAMQKAATAQREADIAVQNAAELIRNGIPLAPLPLPLLGVAYNATDKVWEKEFPGEENGKFTGSLWFEPGSSQVNRTFRFSLDARLVSGDWADDDYFIFGQTYSWIGVDVGKSPKLNSSWQHYSADIVLEAGSDQSNQGLFIRSYAGSAGAKTVQMRNISIKNVTEAKAAQDMADAVAQTVSQQGATIDGLITYSTANAHGIPVSADAIWFTIDATGRVLRMYKANADATGWVQTALTNEVIANLDAGKITTGYLDAARLKAQSIATDRLLVGDQTNLWGNQYFVDGGPMVGSASSIAPPAGAARLLNSRDMFGPDATAIEVREGDRLVLECTAKRHPDHEGTLGLNGGLWYTTQSSGDSWAGYAALADVGVVDGDWHRWRRTFTVPAGKQRGVLYFQLNQNASGGTTGWLVSDMTLRRMVDGVMIADGAVTASKVAAEAIEGNKIKAGAIDGKTITGATIQTTNKRLHIADSGITAADANGDVTFNVSASTGVVTINLTGSGTQLKLINGSLGPGLYAKGPLDSEFAPLCSAPVAIGHWVFVDTAAPSNPRLTVDLYQLGVLAFWIIGSGPLSGLQPNHEYRIGSVSLPSRFCNPSGGELYVFTSDEELIHVDSAGKIWLRTSSDSTTSTVHYLQGTATTGIFTAAPTNIGG